MMLTSEHGGVLVSCCPVSLDGCQIAGCLQDWGLYWQHNNAFYLKASLKTLKDALQMGKRNKTRNKY